MPMISYAQNREDVVLARALPGATGFYIDVGAAHPVGHSVTKHFYEKGWSGVNVEPQPMFFDLIVRDRPRDVNLNAAVSGTAGECTFYEVRTSLGTSTLDPALAEQIRQSGGQVVPYTVRTVPLSDICLEHVGSRTIDFLKVDAEGHELAVLSSMDFRRWRPRLVVVETTNYHLWDSLVLAAGYRFALYDGLNRFYAREEEADDLLPRLAAPACCLDDFVPHELADRIAELERQLADARRPGTVAAVPTPAAVSPAAPVPRAPLGRRPGESIDGRMAAAADRVAAAAAAIKAARAAAAEAAVRTAAAIAGQQEHLSSACDAADRDEWAARTAKAAAAPDRPLRVLFAIASGSQMYSGIGRAIVERVKRAGGAVAYEFAMDSGNPRNVDLLARFCREQGLPLHVGRAGPGNGDAGNADLPALLRRGDWDAVECVSFASAATNQAVLDHAGGRPIVYTPHTQPMWTVPFDAAWHRDIEAAHTGLLRHSALVCCDTPHEWLTLRAAAGPGVDCALMPLGFDPEAFTPGTPDRRPYLLFVGDLVEKRKRFPLVARVFAEVLRRHPQLQLVVVGNKSDQLAAADVPETVRRQCVLRGYVPEEQLRTLYREAAGLVQLSDFEAFGLPILEALAAGTPVFLTRRPTVAGAFGRYHGTVLVDDADPAEMAEPISAVLDRGPDFVTEVLADRPRLVAELGWESCVRRHHTALRAAVAGHAAGARAAA